MIARRLVQRHDVAVRFAVLIAAVAAVALLGALVGCSQASAHGRHHHRHLRHPAAALPQGRIECDRRGCRGEIKTIIHIERRHSASAIDANGNDPRPGAWCAWWLRRDQGIPRSAFRPYEWNLARAFRYIGTPAPGPAIGVIVVWWHHVGIITGRTDTGWIVKSGNDDHAVRERERSLRGVIAFRYARGFAGL